MPILYNLDNYHNDYYVRSPSVVSSSSSSAYSMNTDGNINIYGSTMGSSPISSNMSPLSSNMSPLSSNMSPLSSDMSPVSSTSDSSSAYSFQNLKIGSPYATTAMSSDMGQHEPYLQITEQPIDKFRFRYKSEMHGTHGSLTGQKTSRSKKTAPSVYLHNYNGEGVVRCSLFQIPKPGHESPLPHSHSLVIRCGNDDRKDPHEVTVSLLHGYSAVFQGMGIIHTARRFIEDELHEKLVAQLEFEFGRELSLLEKEKLKSKAKKEAADMNLNQVSLCFEAFERINGKWTRICDPVFSTPINNMKSALTGELKISRLSAVVGSAAGNDDLFLFVEKVGKKNIKVRFYEIDDYENVTWEDWGRFSEADVHHQYAIALKTPPYRTANIEQSVKVYIQLYRPGDDSQSEPVEFRYKPSNSMNSNRKRPRITSSLHSTEIPLVVTESDFGSTNNAPSRSGRTNDTSISAEFDLEGLVQEIFTNNQNDLILSNEDLNEMMQYISDCSDEDNLAKDAVAQNDDHCYPHISSIADRFASTILKKIAPLLVRCSDVEKNLQIGSKFLEHLFRNAYLNGESLIHLGAKTDDTKLMANIWEVTHKFKLYTLLRLQNDSNQTCVHLACALNKSQLLQEFLRFGANVNDVDIKGDTALHVAIQENNDECVSVLLNATANAWNDKITIDLNILNDNGFAPLHLAAKNDNLNIVKMLETKAVEQKVSIFQVVETKHGNSALHIAIESGARNVVEYIAKNRHISAVKTNLSGHTAIYLARVMNAIDLVQIMLEHSPVDLNVSDEDNSSTRGDSFSSVDSKDSAMGLNITESAAKPTKTPDKLQNVICASNSKRKFDDICFTQLSDIFNKNGKWKQVANALGFQQHIDSWHKLRNPTKVLLIFSESLKVPKEDLMKIFEKLGEDDAIECINKWKLRN